MLGSSISPIFDLLQFSSAELRLVTPITEKALSRWQSHGYLTSGRAANNGRAYCLAHVLRAKILVQLTQNVGMPIGDAAVAADISVNYVRHYLPTDQAGNKVLVLDAVWSTLSLCLSKQDGVWCSGLVDPTRPGYLDGDCGYAHIMLPFQQIANYAIFEVINPIEAAA